MKLKIPSHLRGNNGSSSLNILILGDQPHMCEDIKTRDPTAGDGEYVLYPTAASMHGCPTKIYCSNMASGSPLEFVTLPTLNEGNYPKVHTMTCIEELPYLFRLGVGSQGNYLYSKIRIHVKVRKGSCKASTIKSRVCNDAYIWEVVDT